MTWNKLVFLAAVAFRIRFNWALGDCVKTAIGLRDALIGTTE